MSVASSTGVAILGAGIFAYLDIVTAHLPSLENLGPLAPTLKAVYSRSEKSARELADEAAARLNVKPTIYHDSDPASNLDALLARSDISSVIVILPITQQPSIILKALAAGKHVLSEKPVAPDVASGVRLIAQYNAEYKPKGLVWRVAENWEAEPAFIAAGKAIRAGKIGKVVFFNMRVVNYIDQETKWYKTPWRTIPDVGLPSSLPHDMILIERYFAFTNIVFHVMKLDGGVHSVAALRVMLPSPLTHISSFASLNKAYLAPQDTINSIVKAADNSHGIFELTFAAPSSSHSSLSSGTIITGSDGYISVAQTKVTDPVTGENKTVFRVTITSLRGVELELASFFAAALEGNDDGLGDPFGALKDVAFIQAALSSEGHLVDLEKLIIQS